jgi:tetraacyldisaccharide 4'-kinase
VGWPRRQLERSLNAIWYGRRRPWPGLALLEKLYIHLRERRINARDADPPTPLALPVIVVGNITAGGAGKTPLVLALIEGLRRQGWRPGVVSRGYGRKARGLRRVSADSTAEQVGDEPLLLHRRSGAPVVVASDRRAAAQALLAGGEVDLILSDDGLEHWNLPRQLEIVVIDSKRGFGNGRLLPLGPLRAPAARTLRADLLVSNRGEWPNAHEMTLQPVMLRSLDGVEQSLDWLRGRRIRAAAGIALPQRFFDTLQTLGAELVEVHELSDHADAAELGQTLVRSTDYPWLITEKDAMKLAPHARFGDVHVLTVSAQLPGRFWQALQAGLEARGLAPRAPLTPP